VYCNYIQKYGPIINKKGVILAFLIKGKIKMGREEEGVTDMGQGRGKLGNFGGPV